MRSECERKPKMLERPALLMRYRGVMEGNHFKTK
jgi:hypothetical protein